MTEQINALAALARREGDYSSEQFMQWFIKEQIEEVATMSDLLGSSSARRTVRWTSRTTSRASSSGEEAADPTAPHPAGARR